MAPHEWHHTLCQSRNHGPLLLEVRTPIALAIWGKIAIIYHHLPSFAIISNFFHFFNHHLPSFSLCCLWRDFATSALRIHRSCLAIAMISLRLGEHPAPKVEQFDLEIPGWESVFPLPAFFFFFSYELLPN